MKKKPTKKPTTTKMINPGLTYGQTPYCCGMIELGNFLGTDYFSKKDTPGILQWCKSHDYSGVRSIHPNATLFCFTTMANDMTRKWPENLQNAGAIVLMAHEWVSVDHHSHLITVVFKLED